MKTNKIIFKNINIYDLYSEFEFFKYKFGKTFIYISHFCAIDIIGNDTVIYNCKFLQKRSRIIRRYDGEGEVYRIEYYVLNKYDRLIGGSVRRIYSDVIEIDNDKCILKNKII